MPPVANMPPAENMHTAVNMPTAANANDVVCEYLLRATAAGSWVLSDRSGHEGGTFRSREAAERFVRHTSFSPRYRISIVTPGSGGGCENEAA